MPTRVGIDLISVESVRESIRSHDRRYLERVYTEQEIRDCRTEKSIDAERLAARFAAKEATIKVLRPGAEGLPWKSIRIRRDSGGWVELELSGRAEKLANDAGVTDLALSLTHEGGFAAAVVVAKIESSND